MFEKILLIKEILELIQHFRKALLIILIVGLFLIILLFNWIAEIDREKEQELLDTWMNINIGDSLFVRNNVIYLDFYKKGRQQLSDYEQKEIKYKREDSLNFIEQNSIHEKYFYKNCTSFIGICLGRDSSVTKAGKYKSHKWIRIKTSYDLTHPPRSDKYDYDARKWEDNYEDYAVNGRLSKDFYVNLSDIQTFNNDSLFI